MVDLKSSGSILNQTEVLGLKMKIKQSLRMKSGLSSSQFISLVLPFAISWIY
jgi:hypothetical protein